MELFILSPFFFLFFLALPLGWGDSALGGLPFCWGCSDWPAGSGGGSGGDDEEEDEWWRWFNTGGLLLSSLTWG